MNGAITPVEQIDRTFYFITGISFLMLTLITFLMIYFVIKYRRSKHPQAADIRGNWILELIWTLVPLVIVLLMFFYGWESYLKLVNVPSDAMEIKVIARKWSWEFKYSESGKDSVGEMVVPLGRPIKLTLNSEDVVHGFGLPSFRIKKDCVPGKTNYAWFFPDKVGVYDIFCTQYCGLHHSRMLAKLKIVTPQEFSAWLKQEEENE